MKSSIKNKVESLRAFHRSGQTKSISFRLEQLQKLKVSILSHQTEIENALWSDLSKSPEESYLTEVSIVLQEIDLHIKNLRRWAKPTRVRTPLHLYPSRSSIYYEPLGVALIIAPWNYPFQLMLNPLIGAISSGCCAMMKPSPAASMTANVVEKIITATFDSSYIDIVQGGREINGYLLEHKYDFIFFTGSPELGRIVYKSAAENLTPVILELGGKSPCIVDKDADIKVSAKRIAWGKWLNAGQTCIAPDYLFVHSSVKAALLSEIKSCCIKMYGEEINKSRFYPRIVSDSAFVRVSGLLKDEQIYYGGQVDSDTKYISPTILDNITPASRVMQEEIFGPLLPTLTFDKIEEVIDYVNSKEKPLALYYFGGNSKQVISSTSSGGACVNDTIMHISNHNLPFGGVGNSGMGKYHGKSSFLLFSNSKGVVCTSTWIDLPFKYPPFKYFKLVKRIL